MFKSRKPLISTVQFSRASSKNDPAIVDPLALIPPQHRETPSVAVAHVEFLRSRNAPDWQKTARAAFEKFPEEHYLRQFVAEDTAFLLDNGDDKNLWFMIEGDEDRVSEGLLSPAHPFAVQSIGHPAGYSFEMIHSFQKQQNWTIKEVKHKYLWLFHEIMENFENWYPGVNGISRFTMKGDDITPVLDQVKKSAENLNRVAELYTEKRTPLALVAAHLHRDPIWFAGYRARHPTPFRKADDDGGNRRALCN